MDQSRIFNIIKDILVTEFDIDTEEVSFEAGFLFDLDLDELDFIELVMFLEEEFEIEIDERECEVMFGYFSENNDKDVTVGQLVDILYNKLNDEK